MNPEEIALLTKVIGGGGGGLVVLYLMVAKALPFLNNKDKHAAPCSELQVSQSKVEALEKNNKRQWDKMDTMSTTLGEIKGATDIIIRRLPGE